MLAKYTCCCMFVNCLNVTNILNLINFIRPHVISADSMTNNTLTQMSRIQDLVTKLSRSAKLRTRISFLMGYF